MTAFLSVVGSEKLSSFIVNSSAIAAWTTNSAKATIDFIFVFIIRSNSISLQVQMHSRSEVKKMKQRQNQKNDC